MAPKTRGQAAASGEGRSDTGDPSKESRMSVVGFDVGSESGIVAVARQRGIDVVLNDESKLETPAIVCFSEKQRYIGTAGAASSTMNPNNSIYQIKRLIGRKFSDPEIQRDIQNIPFAVTEGPDGFPLIQARYLGEHRTFTPTQVFGMILSNLKGIAENNLNVAVVDCCIGIPVYFTDLQRRAVLDAATIAGLNPLRLFHETTGTALAYGIYKTDLPKNDQLNVAFVDVGHASMQVCIAGFKKGQLKILAHSFDQSLGGRDFDEALFKHFAAKFEEEYKIDVYQNARDCLRLRAACEKLRKMLSANSESPMNIECLMDEKDVRGLIKREEFEKISKPLLERVKGPLEKVLVHAGLKAENIHSVEVVGSGSRVPAIIKILREFFGKEPRRTMNSSGCVARGCALLCAMLSPTFKVCEFQVYESLPFSVALSWGSYAPKSETENRQSVIVFPKGNPFPSVKALTFFRSSTFSVDVLYADASELPLPSPNISTYTLGPFQSANGERAKVKVKVRLNLHGIVSVESAAMLEEEEVEVPIEPLKKKAKKTNVPVVEVVYGGLAPADLLKAMEKVPYERLANIAVWYSQQLSSITTEMRHHVSSMPEVEVDVTLKLQAAENALEATKSQLEAASSENTKLRSQIKELNKALAEEKVSRTVAEGKAIAAEGVLAAEREIGMIERSSLRSKIKALLD